MPHQAKVSQWGNSLAIRLPQSIVQDLAITKGTSLEFYAEDDGFKVKIPSIPKKYTLEELLADVKPENLHKEIDWGKTQGEEIW